MYISVSSGISCSMTTSVVLRRVAVSSDIEAGPKPTPVFQRIDLEAWQGKWFSSLPRPLLMTWMIRSCGHLWAWPYIHSHPWSPTKRLYNEWIQWMCYCVTCMRLHHSYDMFWHIVYDPIRCQKQDCPSGRHWIKINLAGAQFREILERCHNNCHMLSHLSPTSLKSSKSGRRALPLGRLKFMAEIFATNLRDCLRDKTVQLAKEPDYSSEVYRSAMFVMLTHVDSCWLSFSKFLNMTPKQIGECSPTIPFP